MTKKDIEEVIKTIASTPCHTVNEFKNFPMYSVGCADRQKQIIEAIKNMTTED